MQGVSGCLGSAMPTLPPLHVSHVSVEGPVVCSSSNSLSSATSCIILLKFTHPPGQWVRGVLLHHRAHAFQQIRAAAAQFVFVCRMLGRREDGFRFRVDRLGLGVFGCRVEGLGLGLQSPDP